MGYALIVPSYFIWHYTHALRHIFRVWLTLLWYILHFFSISLLLRTLFSPWHRMQESRNQGDGLSQSASIVLVNGMSRIVGLCIKVPIIITGFALLSLAFVGIGIFYVLWLCAPLIIITCVSTGIGLILLSI